MSKVTMQSVTLDQIPGYAGRVLIPVDEDLSVDGYVSVSITKGGKTDAQRRALHKYCELLADKFTAGGLDMAAVLSERVDCPWSMLMVKEAIWKDLQEIMLGRRSTEKLNKDEVDKVYRVVDRWTQEKFNISVPFPSRHFDEHGL